MIDTYNSLMREVIEKAGNQMQGVISQPYCEYEPVENGFMGFLDVYDAVRKFVPKSRRIIDLGCYLAAQSFLFDDYREYIGVDIVEMNRFKTANSRHYVMTIQDFIRQHASEYKDAFAICSYVPDENARMLVRCTFEDCLIYYPSWRW